LTKTRVRIDFLGELSTITSIESEEYDRWSKTRLNHLLVDYLSRQGYHDSAQFLSKDVVDLVDLDLFVQAKSITTCLLNHSCQEALAWCGENKSSLKKLKSSLEFQLRLQEYIELVKERKLGLAILYSKKYLVGWSDTHLKEIQQASGLLAFEPSTSCSVYRALYDEKRWDYLVQLFHQDNFQLNNLTKQPMLNLTIQAGLTALKTHSCNQPDSRNVNCPVCSVTFSKISKTLPNSHHVNSSLVCRISGKLMDESNPPLVLPNGYCYSSNVFLINKALTQMQEQMGRIVCPRTGGVFQLSETRKAYIS
jgi:macrophage erythroblast attacher